MRALRQQGPLLYLEEAGPFGYCCDMATCYCSLVEMWVLGNSCCVKNGFAADSTANTYTIYQHTSITRGGTYNPHDSFVASRNVLTRYE